MTSSQWLKGANIPLERISLAPRGMQLLSENKDRISKAEMKYNSRVELLKSSTGKDDESQVFYYFLILLL